MKKNSSQLLLLLKIIFTATLIVIFYFFIKNDFLKFRTFLAENPISHSLQIEQKKVKNKAIVITINHYRPDLSLWKNFLVTGRPPDKSFLNDSVRYYEIISGYAPDVAETQHLLGLCYYFLGNKDAALASQRKAAALEPRFFWAWYDLGIMYYREGEFLKSAQAFKKALSASPTGTIQYVRSSKIFVEILRSVDSSGILNQQTLQNGYRDAALMLEASAKRLRGQPPGINEQEIPLKAF